MTLSIDDLLQSNSGTFEALSGTVSLPAATTAGTTVLVFVGYGFAADGTSSLGLSMSGFDNTGGFGSNSAAKAGLGVFTRRANPGGETSWTLTVTRTGGALVPQVTWQAFEVQGIGADPLGTWFVDPGLGNYSYDGASPTSKSTLTTTLGSCYDVAAFAVHVARSATTTVPAWSNQTNGFTELNEVTHVNATNAVSMAVSWKTQLGLHTYESTADVSPGSPASAYVIGFYLDGAKHAPDIHIMTGFGFGTATQLAFAGTPPTGSDIWSAPFDLVVGSPGVDTTSPRSGAYCGRFNASAAAQYAAWTNSGSASHLGRYQPLTGYPLAVRGHVRFRTALPSADVELFSIEGGSAGNGMVCWYRSASQKIGMVVGTGTEVLSDATVSTGHWIGVDARYDARATTHKLDWAIDYNADTADMTGPVTQAQASNTGMTVATLNSVVLGWKNARTADIDYADWFVSKSWGAYPLGDMRTKPLKADPAGVMVYTGSSADFEVFTSNGTVSVAVTDAGVRNAVDDIPPTIGASADGVSQVNVSSSLIRIPVEPWTAAPDNVPIAARAYVAGWARSVNPATVKFYFHDGTQFRGLATCSTDFGFDDTALQWVSAMLRAGPSAGFYQLTQAIVDALCIGMGESTDANPDIGMHSFVVEVAYAPAVTWPMSEQENGAFTLYAKYAPKDERVVSYVVTTPSGTRGATLTYDLAGVPQTPIYVGPGQVQPYSTGAETIDDVTNTNFTPDTA